MGAAMYGRGFLLDDPSKNSLHAPASNPIPAGPFSQQEGTWGYNEVTNCTQCYLNIESNLPF
jgi:hypothetical protein